MVVEPSEVFILTPLPNHYYLVVKLNNEKLIN